MTPSQIRALRKSLKLSPDEFAEQLGFTDKSRRITIWRWESGKHTLSLQTIMLMKQLPDL